MDFFSWILQTCGLLFVIFNVIQTNSVYDAALKAHNEYRAKHGSPALEIDEEANAFAQKYAEKLVSKCNLIHSHDKYGENLWAATAYGTATEAFLDDSENVRKAVKAWYDEISKYDFNNPGFSSDTGHFTQVVWKGSKLLGIGVKQHSDGNNVCVIVVAEYFPAGNMNYKETFAENVLKAKSTSVQPQWIVFIIALAWHSL